MPTVTTTSPFENRLTPEIVSRDLQNLPSSPRVLPRLITLLGDGNSSLSEIVSLIKLDQGIAARALQVGNSAYFSYGTRCRTVDEAVNRVGFDRVYQFVLTAVSSQILVRPLSVYGLEAGELWRKSVICALAAEILARHLQLDKDVAYTVGLFHAVGLVAIDDWAVLHQPELQFPAATLPLETCPAERKALGFHNGEVAAALLRHWDFSLVVSEPLRWQYFPRSTVAHQPLAGLLHVAKWIRTAVCTKEAGLPPPDQALLKSMGLSLSNLDSFTDETTSRVQDVGRLLTLGEAKGHSMPPFSGNFEI